MANPADSPSANTTVPAARPYVMPALNGFYFPALQTSNLTTSTGLSNSPSGLVASVNGKAGAGTISFPTLDTTKPFRIAVKITMGETGGTGATNVKIVNTNTGGGWQIGTAGNQLNEYFMNSHLTNVPAGTVIWFSFASDGANLMTCMIPDRPQSLRLLGTAYSAPWPPASLDCAEQAANVPVNLPDRAATTSINQIAITSSSTATVVNGIYLSEGRLDAPSDSRMLPPMVLNTAIGLDVYNGSRVNSYLGNIPTLTEIFVPGTYGTPDGTPVVLMHHPYGNTSPPASAQSTMAALFNDGYMVVMPTAMANYGGDGNYTNALASNGGAPSGLLIRKQVVDWVRQSLPATWQLYQFGTSMGCTNALEYEKWWPGNAAIACVSGSTSLTVASSPPYGKGAISSADATAFSGFYVALQASTGQNPASSANFWKQISVAPGFMDEMYLHNPPFNFADTWSATKTYSMGQIVAVPYAGSLASLAPYDPALNPQTYASVPVYMSTCNTDQTIAAENQAFYDALHAIGGDVTLQIISDGICGHQSADLFFPSATVSFFDRHRKHNVSSQTDTAPAPAASTTTTLSITYAGSSTTTVAAGSSVTLTAAVQAGGTPVTAGQVSFCDSDPTQCTGNHVVGTAQLTASGIAAVNLVPAIGIHSYTAIFAGTDLYASSSSSATSLTVAGLYRTATTIAQSGSAGNYTLTATVAGTGAMSAPSGTVSFLDASVGNSVLATAVLGPGAPHLAWVNSQTPGTGQGPQSVVVADFNDDGRPDLAVANLNDKTVTVLLGSGDGTFFPGSVAAAGNGPAALAVGDFNGDGKPDLAVANFQDNSVTVRLGNGDGTFAPAANEATGAHPAALAVGDFNGDGNLDLAVANSGDNTVTVLLGSGEGTFTRSSSVSATGSFPDSIAVGDFNGDGELDLAVANGGSNSVTVLRGNGDGTFAAATSPPTGARPVWIVAGDFNRDGAADLAVANYGDSTITVLLGIGDATFAVAPSLSAGASPEYIAVLDFNRDGNLDLAVAASGADSATLLLGNGDGTFTPSPAAPATGSFSNSVAVADFDSDGGPDLAITNFNDNTVSVLLSQMGASVTATATGISPLGTGPHLVRATYSGDGNYFGSVSGDTGLTAQQVTPAITWAAPAAIAYGTALSGAQLNASSAVAGTYAYSPALGTVLPAGSHTLSVTFTPADTASYSTATATVTLGVNQAASAITWAAPAAITYGTALSGAQLNASSTVAGTYAYSPALGTVLPAGSHTLSVTFMPADTANYSTATATVTLGVNQAAPAITWAAPAAITYGTALSGAQLNASSAVGGTYAYSPAPGTVLPAGSHTLSVSFTPADTANYSTAMATVTLGVNQAAPAITWAAPAAITYGTALSGAQLNASSTTPGSFVYSPAAGVVPGTGTQTLTVTFMPADTADYTSATAAVALTVNKATQAITFASLPSAVTIGSAPVTLTATSSSGLPVAFSETGPASLNGSALAIMGAGTITVTASQAGNANYSPANPVTETIDVGKATPTAALTASSASVIVGLPVTFTATVTGNGATPSGTVTFYSGTTLLGASALGSRGAATLTVTTLAIGSNANTVSYAGDSNFTPATSAAVEVSVLTKPTPTIALASSASSIVLGSPVTLTATVTGSGAVPAVSPTGSVTFLNGTATLGAGTLTSSGLATLEATSLPVGAASITAAYAGDSNFGASTSSALPIAVTAPVVDFTVAATPSSRTVYMGQAASYEITITPVSGVILPVTLRCSQLPANSSCTFSPVTGGSATSSTLVVQTTAPNNSTTAFLFSAGSNGMALAALLLFFVPLRTGRFRKRWPAFFVALALLAAGTSTITGCGGTYSIATGTPVGGQAITVTVTADNGAQAITHEAVLTLDVLPPQ